MTYENLIETVSLIVENDKIVKDGLMLVYELDPIKHKKMNEFLFYKANPTSRDFKASEEFEIEIGGILVKLVKRKPTLNLEDSN